MNKFEAIASIQNSPLSESCIMLQLNVERAVPAI